MALYRITLFRREDLRETFARGIDVQEVEVASDAAAIERAKRRFSPAYRPDTDCISVWEIASEPGRFVWIFDGLPIVEAPLSDAGDDRADQVHTRLEHPASPRLSAPP